MDVKDKSESQIRAITVSECTGCGLITNSPQSYMELVKKGGGISCCPERRIVLLICVVEDTVL